MADGKDRSSSVLIGDGDWVDVLCCGEMRRIAKINGRFAMLGHEKRHFYRCKSANALTFDPCDCVCMQTISAARSSNATRRGFLEAKGLVSSHRNLGIVTVSPNGLGTLLAKSAPRNLANAAIAAIAASVPASAWPLHVGIAARNIKPGWYPLVAAALYTDLDLLLPNNRLAFRGWSLLLRPSWYRTVCRVLPAVVCDRLIIGVVPETVARPVPGYIGVETVPVVPAMPTSYSLVHYYRDNQLYKEEECLRPLTNCPTT